jgi:ribosome-binding factor A
MASRRVERLSDLIKQETSGIIQNEMRDPRVGFITVTSVDLSQDLRHAKIFVSIMGTDKEREKTMNALDKACGFIRTRLGSKIRIRHVPEVIFRLDESYEYAARIAEVMKQIKPEIQPSAESEESDESSVEDTSNG